MAYIGKVSVTSAWEKAEDLIKAQVSGQSSFSFDTNKTYSLQTDCQQPSPFGARLCSSATKPSDDDAGEHLSDSQYCVYQPESGVYLWIKRRGNTSDLKVSISEI